MPVFHLRALGAVASVCVATSAFAQGSDLNVTYSVPFDFVINDATGSNGTKVGGTTIFVPQNPETQRLVTQRIFGRVDAQATLNQDVPVGGSSINTISLGNGLIGKTGGQNWGALTDGQTVPYTLNFDESIGPVFASQLLGTGSFQQDVSGTVVFGPAGAVDSLIGSAVGTLETTYHLRSPQEEGLNVTVIKDLNNKVIQSQKPVLSDDPDSPVGVIDETDGIAFVTRTDGTVEIITIGTPIFQGDIVETDAGGNANIVFIDETSLTVGENAKLGIDEYVFDPTDPNDPPDVSFLRGLFEFTAGLIERDEPEEINLDAPMVTLGSRGDATPYVRDDLLNNPVPELGEVGYWTEQASPATLSTFVDATVSPFEISFDYFFLDPEMTLAVTLGEVSVYNAASAPEIVGARQSASFVVEFIEGLTELSFTFDGPSGDGSGIIANLVAPGTGSLNFDGWFDKDGGGRSEVVYLTSDEQLAELQRRIDEDLAAVPLPLSGYMLLAAMGLLGWQVRRKV